MYFYFFILDGLVMELIRLRVKRIGCLKVNIGKRIGLNVQIYFEVGVSVFFLKRKKRWYYLVNILRGNYREFNYNFNIEDGC